MTAATTAPADEPQAKSAHEALLAERANELLRNSITPEQLPALLDHYLKREPGKPDIAVAIWGAVGIGKTTGARDYAKKNLYRFIAIHLQLYDPSDIKGIPVKLDDGQVRWVNTSFLPQQKKISFHSVGHDIPIEWNWPHAEFIEVEFDDPALKDQLDWSDFSPKTGGVLKLLPGVEEVRGQITIMEKALVLLDEISTANTDVQNAALSLVLDRRAGEYELNTACRVLAAGNTENDGAFTNPISFALANRFLHLTMRTSVPVFLRYAIERRLNPILISFLNMWGAEYLHRRNDGAAGGDYGSPTPRTWEMWSQQYRSEHDPWMRRATTTGLLGSDTGTRMLGFLTMTEKLPNPMDILEGKSYSWTTRDRVTSLMMIGLLATRLREVFDTWRHAMHGLRPDDLIVDPAKQPPEWITALDGIYGFMNQHLENDGRTAGHYMIVDIARIPNEVLHGEGFSKFANDCVGIIREVNKLIK